MLVLSAAVLLPGALFGVLPGKAPALAGLWLVARHWLLV